MSGYCFESTQNVDFGLTVASDMNKLSFLLIKISTLIELEKPK